MQIVRIGAGDGPMSVAQAHILMESIRRSDPGVIPELVQFPEAAPDRSDIRPGYVESMVAAVEQGQIQLAVVNLKEIPIFRHPRVEVAALSQRLDAGNALLLPPGVTSLSPARPVACSGLRRRGQLAALHPEWNLQMVDGDLITRLAWLDDGHFGALVTPVCQMQMLGVQRPIHLRYPIHQVTPTVGEGMAAVLGLKGRASAQLAAFHSAESWDMMTAEWAFLSVFDGARSATAHAVVKPGGDEIAVQGVWIDPEQRIWRRQMRGRRQHALMLGAALAQQIRLDRDKALGVGLQTQAD